MPNHEEEIKEIKKNQECLDSILEENSELLKRIDSEIQRLNQSKQNNSDDDLIKDVKKIKKTENKSIRKCRYFNIAKIKVNVNFHTQAKSVKNIFRRASVRINLVKEGIQRRVNGQQL